jgi:hypothetical protein
MDVSSSAGDIPFAEFIRIVTEKLAELTPRDCDVSPLRWANFSRQVDAVDKGEKSNAKLIFSLRVAPPITMGPNYERQLDRDAPKTKYYYRSAQYAEDAAKHIAAFLDKGQWPP